jgi:hypothetical protein
MPKVNSNKALKQQPLDIGTFISNPSKKRINQHKKLTTKAGPCAGPRAHKIPAWLVKKMKERAIREEKMQSWVVWLEARGNTIVLPDETARLQDTYGDAPPVDISLSLSDRVNDHNSSSFAENSH